MLMTKNQDPVFSLNFYSIYWKHSSYKFLLGPCMKENALIFFMIAFSRLSFRLEILFYLLLNY